MFHRFINWFELSFVHNNMLRVGKQYAIINDGAYDYSLLTYYIAPSAQIEQLKDHFQNVRIFLSDGCEAKKTELESLNDWWLYFLCNVKS